MGGVRNVGEPNSGFYSSFSILSRWQRRIKPFSCALISRSPTDIYYVSGAAISEVDWGRIRGVGNWRGPTSTWVNEWCRPRRLSSNSPLWSLEHARSSGQFSTITSSALATNPPCSISSPFLSPFLFYFTDFLVSSASDLYIIHYRA